MSRARWGRRGQGALQAWCMRERTQPAVRAQSLSSKVMDLDLAHPPAFIKSGPTEEIKT